MHCPRCSQALVDKRIGDATVRVCSACDGALVRQKDLIHVLETSAPVLCDSIDLDAPIEPIPDPGQRLPCPVCGQAMTAFGYMGARTVTVDRCSDDWVLWADADELGTMALMYARSNRHVIERLTRDQKRRLEQDRRLLSTYKARAAAGRVRHGGLHGPSVGETMAMLWDFDGGLL